MRGGHYNVVFKKGRSNKRKGLHDAETLYPVLHVISTLKDYQKEMVRKEVESLLELSKVGSSFDGVLNEADQFQGQLQDFGQSFSSINQAAGQFAQVRTDITQTVSEAQDMVEELKLTSAQVQKTYSEMEHTLSISRPP